MAQKAATARNEQGTFLSTAFSSFSVDDLNTAKQFYGDKLGLEVKQQKEGLSINFIGGLEVFIYPKEDHSAASFTVLNFPVDDIDEAADELSRRGIKFEFFEGEIQTDLKGIFRGKETNKGPDIAWFKDPAGNYLSILEN